MANANPYNQESTAYDNAFTELYTDDEAYDALSLDIDDDRLDKMLITSLETDRDYWNKKPWQLQKTDIENTAFLLGEQLNERDFLKNDSKYVDNRLFSSVRAILSYATGQLAKPDITPSKGDDVYLKGARDIGSSLYQHSADERVEHKVRAAVLNLISRKRGFLKLRWDPNLGLNGDITTEVCNPEDVIISRTAGYLENPDKIYHRIRCSVEDLVAKFPDKQADIYTAFSIQRGVYTQVSRMVTYFECWFTYMENGVPKEGVCWFVPEKHLILDKMQNPNWVYMKDRKKEKEANVVSVPPKPFVSFNYINTGHSYIDETCLVEQARPMQEMLNKRGRQIWENADYVNGRWVADKNAFSQEDAHKLVNKGAKTVAMADLSKVANPLQNIASSALPNYVENTLYDARNEIDGIMGTPSVFKGSQPDKQDTLGRDLMVKQQAGALQDDLVRSISTAMEEYYKIKLQMMRVYYTDDYWFQVKGGDGKFQFLLINGENLDTNVRVGVQVDSTLPLDKAMIRQTAMELWNAGQAIDYRTFMEDLGLPNPEVRTERYLRSKIDPIGYLESVEDTQMNAEAESDIMLLEANKTPEERDDYDANYFNYFNRFMTGNRFQKMKPEAQQRITMFLAAVQHIASNTANLQEGMLDDAGITTAPLNPPAPQKKVTITGSLTPEQSAQEAGIQPPQSAAPPAPSAPVPTQ